jgi:RHS repeat-associated protein
MGTDPDNITQPVEPEKRLYKYDPIGNRNTATEGTESKSYAANSLNQYEEVAAGGSTLSLAYDEGGNLTAYNGVNYTYNAENRLVAVEPASPVDGDTKVECVYDYMGRRVKKAVYDYNAGSWQLEKEKLFVYDGWNLVEEITVAGATETSRYFVWGLDLSQSLQGAGGIGGLLATVDGADTYYFAYDGNGNVGQVIDASTSTIAGSYQYDPFGNLIKSDGAYADDNPFRFSTKYHDDETGLVYYGYRYYSAELGRWISRDPLGEEGGNNLHSYVNNNPTNFYDYLGLKSKKECERYNVEFKRLLKEYGDAFEKLSRITEKLWEINELYRDTQNIETPPNIEQEFDIEFAGMNFQFDVNVDFDAYKEGLIDNVKLQILKYKRMIYLQNIIIQQYQNQFLENMKGYNECISACEEGWYCRWGASVIGGTLATSGAVIPGTVIGLPFSLVAYGAAVGNSTFHILACEQYKDYSAASIGLGTASQVTFNPYHKFLFTAGDIVVNVAPLFFAGSD